MPTQTDILAKQIARLMLDKNEKKRLLDELKEINPDKLEYLSGLIREHDEEALNILNEKVAEQKNSKSRLNEVRPDAPGHMGKEEALKMIDALEILFKNPEALGHFLYVSDDAFLMDLEEIFTKNLEKDPAALDEFKKFFTEIRLHKAALASDMKKETRENMINEINSNQENIKKLDQLIAQAEKVLNKEK